MKAIPLAALITALCFFSVNSGAQSTPFLTNGLLAYYPFNGNADDASGNGNDGIVFGATLTFDHFGAAGMAYQFNGTNDYIMANVPTLPTGSSARTVACWAKPNPMIKGVSLIFWGTNQNTQAFQLLNISEPYQWAGGGWGGGDGLETGVIVDTNWHFVVQTYDGARMAMWIDGQKYGPASAPVNTPLSPLYIGAIFNDTLPGASWPNANSQFFSGAINHVRVYNRELSSQEVSQLYRFESGQNAGIVLLPCITYLGNPGGLYTIQYSTNLTMTNWPILASNVVLQSNFYLYTDTNAFNQPQRFYRVLAQ